MLEFVCLIIIGIIVVYFIERDLWNWGSCRDCKGKWGSFDTDSQGGRGYNCSCGRHIWISYHSIDNR